MQLPIGEGQEGERWSQNMQLKRVPEIEPRHLPSKLHFSFSFPFD